MCFVRGYSTRFVDPTVAGFSDWSGIKEVNFSALFGELLVAM